MEDQIKTRLAALRAEFETGQKRLSELDAQRAELMDTMLRISGAIQVLEELASAGAAGEPRSNGAEGQDEKPGANGSGQGVEEPELVAKSA